MSYLIKRCHTGSDHSHLRFSDISLAALLLILASAAVSWASSDFTTLQKYLNARMYSEAYLELMRWELSSTKSDPRLLKLKKDLLPRTRREAQHRAKSNPDDAMLFTILADLDFQEGQFDKAVENITRVHNKASNAISHYIMAKILFVRGDYENSYNEMEKAMNADTTSDVIFADFKFLYNCKNYGLASAKRLTADSGFIERAKPVAADFEVEGPIQSPYMNDPSHPQRITQTQPDEPNVINQIMQIDPTVSDPPDDPDEPDDPELEPDDPDDPDDPEPEPDIDAPIATAEPIPTPEEVDPEKKKIEQAEFFMKGALSKFAEGDFEGAEATLDLVRKQYDGLPGIKELQAKIDEKKTIETEYKKAVALYDNKQFDEAKDLIERAYLQDPKRYDEAPLWLGYIYYRGSNPDLKKAYEYLSKSMKHPHINPETRRQVEWTILQILVDDERIHEAHDLFHDFYSREPDFCKTQLDYQQIKHKVWYNYYKTWIHVGTVFFLGLFLLVFLLKIIPAMQIIVFDPIKKAGIALEDGNYKKAAKIAENVINKKKPPIQIERQLLEIAIQANFELKNYFKCQEQAKYLLVKFAENAIAWKYLAKTYIETKDSSDEAISLYETAYRNNPENVEYLPILCSFYAKNKQFTVESIEIMYTFFLQKPDCEENVLTLAEAYVQTKRMNDDVLKVLPEAIKLQPDNMSFRELLARNFSKKGMHSEAAKECLIILGKNINNMGIHVVYTSAMKKLDMLDEAILQYEEFLKQYPGNAQLSEIITGLRRELEQGDDLPIGLKSEGDLSPFAEELVPTAIGIDSAPMSPDMIDVESFVEPPPEGFMEPDKEIPVPNFFKSDPEIAPIPQPEQTSADNLAIPDDLSDPDIFALPVMDPFAENITDLQPSSPGKPPENKLGDKAASDPLPSADQIPAEPPSDSMMKAELMAKTGKWDEVIKLVSPVYASKRSRVSCLMLTNAYLELKQAKMAKEIIDTLEFDRELIDEEMKETLYRIGVALEDCQDFKEALEIYDLICNADINFKDAFDRSDRLYSARSKS